MLRWHHELVRRHWSAFRPRPWRGRRRVPDELRQLIVRLAWENPRWGDRRIQGALLKLGYRLSATTIRGVLRRDRMPPAPRRDRPTWAQFLAAHAGAILACDFFTLDTVMLRTLYVLVFMEIHSRRILYFDCTAHPNGIWVTQQARNLAWELNQLESPIKLAIKTSRHEALDWLLIFGERHLRLVLRHYVDHYNHERPHLPLDLRPPAPVAESGSGPIIRHQRLSGLINEYSRAA